MKKISHDWQQLPEYDFDYGSVTEELDSLIAKVKDEINVLLDIDQPDFENFVIPLEDTEEKVSKFWGPVSHLNAVKNSDELRSIYNLNIPKLTKFHLEIAQDPRLFQQYLKVQKNNQALTESEKKLLEDGLRDLRLYGAELDDTSKKKFSSISEKLTKLSSQFADNVLDETQDFSLEVKNASDLKGLPNSIIEQAQEVAMQKGMEHAWIFTLDYPSYVPFMKYADNRELREKMYKAYVTRATDGERNNDGLINEALRLRKQKASLLGFDNYVEYSVASKMASSPQEVLDFLRNLFKKTLPFAQREFDELKSFAQTMGCDDLQAWDVPYFSRILKEKKFDVDDELIKAYFPEYKVLEGLFAIVEKIYGLTVTREKMNAWNEDVFIVHFEDPRAKNKNGPQGSIIFDLYARDKKRGGAWMDECLTYKVRNTEVQIPVAYVNCNFSRPVGGKPALFTHDEVETLFHECGHALHHILSEVKYLGQSGINNVPWDGVELPSQFFENWCRHADSISFISEHFETKEPLPKELLNKLIDSKNFHSGMTMLRQLDFSMVDLRIHFDYDFDQDVHDFIKEVREPFQLYPVPDYARFENSFTHIFAGGYAAGYYSYKWAEVLSADCFARFEEEGIFNQATGLSFKEHILSKGGSRNFNHLFFDFRGRKPSIEPLLIQSGLVSS